MATPNPFYLDPQSQTGGLLQNLQQPMQSSLPSISGGTQNYVPGYGTAPYSQQPTQTLDQVIQAAAPYGQGAINQAVAQYNQGTLSSVPSAPIGAPAGAPTGTPNDGSFTSIGGDAWLSPEELRAQTNALQSHQVGDTGSGNGGGSGGSTGTDTGATGGGLNLSGVQGSAGANNGNPAFTNTGGATTGPVIPYQDPGSVNQNGTVGYIGPGGSNVQGQAGVLQMQQANPQAALDAYKNTPGYQLLNAPGAYEQSPGYQYAVDQALKQVQGQASAQGLLGSGSALRAMTDRAQGMAQQDYGNWWNRQNQLYGDYQNRLQGLAGGPTGSADAMTTGANQAQANLQTGSNLGSLFANQGTTGMGGIINTAAAQSGNMINAGQQQANVQSANQATQLAGATLAANQNQNKGLF